MNSAKYKIITDRFYAYFIDFLILASPIIIVEFFITTSNMSVEIVLISSLIYYFGTHFYIIYLHTIYGQTLGKMAVKIKVVDISENKINWRQAILREIPYILFSIIWFGYEVFQIWNTGIEENVELTFFEIVIIVWMIIWLFCELIVALSNEKRKSIHDYIAGTIVMKI